MIGKKNNDMDVDGLLRKAFADDLPADVEAGMRERIERFRERKMSDEKPAAVWTWLFGRAVWAAVSILMLVAGILLQGSKPSSALADRISVIKAEFASLEPERR
jgi:hypothetical protein